METSIATHQTPQTADAPARAHRHRRPRRGRGNDTSNSALTFRPASVGPSATPSEPATGNAPTSQRGRGRGRGKPAQPRTVNGRTFGGQLTRQDTNVSTDSTAVTGLQPTAADFVPGQQQDSTAVQNQPPKRKQQPPKRRLSKSQAPDIATRTHEDIDRGLYECPICTSEVRRNSKVWACHTCWTVFHLACIKKWSTNEGAAAAQPTAQDGNDPPPRMWRCPGCNLPKTDMPKLYACWCGKEIDPKPLAGLPPHSCGNTCGKERAKRCPHPCELPCHAGPCPPCSHMGPTQICFCGKHEVTKRCSETDYDSGWSCGELCGETMPCGEHLCSRPCHEGLCGACEVRMYARCYCGQMEKDILCDDRGEERESQISHVTGDADPVLENWTGSFDCGNVCGREFDCGLHKCELKCHPQDTASPHCPRSPELVTHCPCGKTPLENLTDETRQHCSDPIPQCKQPCARILSCGHQDEQICHPGSCSPCTKKVDIRCRCGRTTFSVICHEGQQETPRCGRVCKALLNCSRHQCDEICCAGERMAAERQNSKRKQRSLAALSHPSIEDFEAEHICTLQCGRLLKCGTHHCTELCHRGPCGTCREAIFEEISCHCGRSVLQPPLPCGTKAPPCRYPCTRPKLCGHPPVAHNCHQDDEACPKCPYLLEKPCMCGKKSVRNQPCWLQDVRCGEVCGKMLKCGSHHCRKTCHRAGECEDANNQPCQQPCGKLKKVCGHPDMENTCHAPFACKEDKPCQSKIYITCECQLQKQEARCGASRSNQGNAGKMLPCTDECARLERNRKLALALNIDQSAHVDGGDHIPYSTETLNLFAEDVKWAQTQEREFRVFASSADEKRLRFKPMQSQQRAFIHALAEDYGFDSESMDPEPHRHVMIWKTPRFVAAPSKTLAEAVRIRKAQRIVNVSDTEASASTAKRTVASTAPYNCFVITNPRFGLMVDEIQSEISSLLHKDMPLTFDIEFMLGEEVILKAISTMHGTELQKLLQDIKPELARVIKAKNFGTAELGSVDSSMQVVRRESTDSAAGDGWSKVAAKKAAPRVTVAPKTSVGSNAFSALGGNKVTFTKKPEKVKAKKEVVVDDWEAAELAEEEKERIVSDASDHETTNVESSVAEAAPTVDPETVVVEERAVGIDSHEASTTPDEQSEKVKEEVLPPVTAEEQDMITEQI